jgi:hypothetical protein
MPYRHRLQPVCRAVVEADAVECSGPAAPRRVRKKLMATFGELERHGLTHNAEPDEPDFAQTRLSAKLECPVWVSICVTGKRQISVECGYGRTVDEIA